MRKIFFVLFSLCVLTASARTTTYNVRIGAGYEADSHGESNLGIALMFQPNICFGKQKLFVFSPTLQYDITVLEEDITNRIHVPLLFGYRARLGERSLFVPKIGPTIGYSISDGSHKNTVLFGPYADLCFEINRFVIGLSGYYSITSAEYYPSAYAITLTMGCKF